MDDKPDWVGAGGARRFGSTADDIAAGMVAHEGDQIDEQAFQALIRAVPGWNALPPTRCFGMNGAAAPTPRMAWDAARAPHLHQ